ncbi:outer membrane beta-barrel protein [Flavobacterium psychrotolerans]|uniref:Porin family protein n=1 Tax=Flavobacterium psychrotolerans TaxID=2169410 RepID=A0A2U1JKM6_9FLAO|nr:outer membrane beta-barrel protein [Flavobacterium psychrotolerans]PWA05428.1 porin family protein [Flavobacterium psychrotolerans]
MKQIILSVVALLAFGMANAQDKKETREGFGKGDLFISGGVSYGSSNDKSAEVKTSGFEIAPKVGFFVTEKIAIGARLGFTTNKVEDHNVTTVDGNTFAMGVFGRYYCTPADKFSVFTNLGFDYSSSKNKLAPSSSDKLNGFEIGLQPGVSYFLSKCFAMEATYGNLGYQTEKSNASGAKSTGTFGIDLDLRSISFGLVYKL